MSTFYFGEQPVGHFNDGKYPLQSGRFQYTPYRGMGHAYMASALKQGRTAECWFLHDERRVAFEVVEEEFVEGVGPGARYEWYVTVSRVDEAREP